MVSQPKRVREPKPALKKREVKGETKTVKFSDKIEVHTFWKRSWNDYKNADMVKGPFTE